PVRWLCVAHRPAGRRRAGQPGPGRVILDFPVGGARAAAAHLTGAGVTWLVGLEERADGLFGTLVDPDGSDLRILELNERCRAADPTVGRAPAAAHRRDHG